MKDYMFCDYGCGKEAKFYFKKVNKWCCSKNVHSCEEVRKHISNKRKGIVSWNKGKFLDKSEKSKNIKNQLRVKIIQRWKDPNDKFNSVEYRKKLSEKRKEWKHSVETKKKISIGNTGKIITENQKIKLSQYMLKGGYLHARKFYTEESKEKQRQYMLNGGAIKAHKGMKKISKEENKLRDIVKELYPACIFQHQILNYATDVAIPEYKIAIEYDGYFHFDTEEHKKYHKLRQEKIERQGWKFLRYTMFDKFPTSEQIKNDIQRIINETN